MNSIWIRIPKTAGVSMEKVFQKLPGKWQPLQDKRFISNIGASHMKSIRTDIWDSSFKFTFVRNPFSRSISSWKFGGWGTRWDCNFKTYVKKVNDINLETPDRWTQLTWHTCAQYPHIVDTEGNLLVDFIGRFENLQEDFNTVCDKIGMPRQQLPHTNKTNHKHYTEYYDDETRQIIEEKYAKDIEYFGYKFGE